MIDILYGSQTGNAEQISKHLHNLLKEANIESKVVVLNEYKPESSESSDLIVFITSTTGDGDPPDNSLKFWRWFKRFKESFFNGRSFALLGLGDTNYTNFNEPAKRLDKKLKELGAVPFIEKALADDATGLEETVDPWIEKLVAKLKETSSLTEKMGRLSVFDLSQDKINGLETLKGLPKQLKEGYSCEKVGFSSSRDYPFASLKGNYDEVDLNNCVLCPIVSHKVIESEAIELGIQIDQIHGYEYLAGSSIAIVCPNPLDLCNELLKELNLESNELLKFEAFTKPMSVLQIAMWILDLHSFPRKSVFRMLSEYCDDPTNKTKLLYLSSSDGSEEYKKLREKRPHLLDLIKTFKTRPSLNVLLEHLPRMSPRYYSIASSYKHSPKVVYIVFNLEEYDYHGTMKRGLCTGWLHNISKNPPVSIPVYPKPLNGMEFTVCERMLMISHGTGISPFIGLARDSTAENQCWLLHGCRFFKYALYKDELTKIPQLKLSIATSREGQKHHVQDLIKSFKDEIVEWIEKGSAIYVCGSVEMAKGVHETLTQVLGSERLKDLQAKKLYKREIW